MEIDQRIPDLSDHELDRLHANAVRLAGSGTPLQRQHAERLLPLIGEAQAARRALRVETQAVKKRAAPRAKTAAVKT